jgi:hypothetical protein
LCLINSVLYFRDYIEATPQTFVLTDNMPVLWAAAHRTDQLKLTRHLLKLYELNINLVFTHIVGGKYSIADYLSRMFIVEEREEKTTTGKTIRVKEKHHILPDLPLMTPITVNDVLELFDESMVQKCYGGANCPSNVNAQLYRGLGPYDYTPTPVCMERNQVETATVKRVNAAMTEFSVTERELKE